ncbi:unnamed protein product [Toxocara canis]|uniref:Reverse transcriptase domain-containing protein n=1 Tax=Toxocara canis TaxID=6265 RepID=A0A183U2B0_TOXCA|nr:unnamed protein product [Toxocara canis]
MTMRKIKWKGGIIIDGEKLNHLRFADDIVQFASNSTKLTQMVRELENESKKVGLPINPQKTKYGPQIKLLQELIEEVDHFLYLGQEINMRHDMSGEISRRIRAGWKCFVDMKEVLTAKLEPDIQAKIFNTTVVKTMTYGSETWSVIKSKKERLAVTKRAMERRMLRFSLRDHITNDKIRNETKVADVDEECWRNKLRWAGHVACIRDNRWTEKIYQWYRRDIKRPPG